MSLKKWLPALCVAGGGIVLAGLLLPTVASLGRPVLKRLLHGYFDLRDLIQEAVTEHRRAHPSPMAEVLVQGAEELATSVVAEEAEEVVAEGVETILEVL